MATHPEEVSRPSGTGKGTVRDVIRNSCACDRVEWMLNLTRFMHVLSREDRILMPMGTTTNESLHAEMDSVFRRVQSLHLSSLECRLSVFQMGRLFSHNAALYRPTIRQMRAGAVRVRAAGCTTLFCATVWDQWLKSPPQAGNAYQRALGERKRMRDWRATNEPQKHARVVVLRRPAAAEALVVPAQPAADRRRTVFRLRRKTRVWH